MSFPPPPNPRFPPPPGGGSRFPPPPGAPAPGPGGGFAAPPPAPAVPSHAPPAPGVVGGGGGFAAPPPAGMPNGGVQQLSAGMAHLSVQPPPPQPQASASYPSAPGMMHQHPPAPTPGYVSYGFVASKIPYSATTRRFCCACRGPNPFLSRCCALELDSTQHRTLPPDPPCFGHRELLRRSSKGFLQPRSNWVRFNPAHLPELPGVVPPCSSPPHRSRRDRWVGVVLRTLPWCRR